MSIMRAVKASAPNAFSIDDSAPIPELQPEYLLVKVSHVALNPSDWRMAAGASSDTPHTVGCDVSGRVVKVGDRVTKPFAPGDRVAGLVFGQRVGHPQSGAFAEYCLVKEGLALRVPDNISDAEAATIGVGITTIGQGLYQTLGVPLPSPTATSIPPIPADAPALLVYGASTATGLFALQFARLSGWRTVAACSPRNFAKCAALGASATFDYADAAACAAAIRAATNDALRHAFDCISEGESLRICADALTTEPNVAKYTALVPMDGLFPRDDVQAGWRAGYTAFGEPYAFPGTPVFEPVMEDYAFARRIWEMVEGLLGKGLIDLAPLVKEREGGLDGVIGGLEELRAGRVSGGKLVYKVQKV